jgi:putative membrane protein
MTRSDLRLLWLSLAVIAALVVSGVQPYDRTTWMLEVAPVLVAMPILVFTRERFPLTPLLYLVIGLHCLVLILGGAYTYARVPLGYWLQDLFELTRNPYDKIGHFMQGFTPALLARELFMRNGHVNGAKMSAFLAVCVALAVSAVYELIEWWAALLLGQGADEFLGTQGDVWDTQSDMFLALVGALAALALFSRLQKRQVVVLQAR